MYLISALCLSATISIINGFIPVTNDMQSFTSALKGAHLTANQETIVYENTDGPGVITELWFTGGFDENTILRIYVDDDYTSKTAAIECKLYMCHNIGYTKQMEQKYTPWSTKRVGHQAYNGGLYNTYQIPFSKQVKVTLFQTKAVTFWFMARGVLNYPIILGNLQLPSNARLRLYKNEALVLQPLQMLTLANITNTSGAVYQVFMSATPSPGSTGYNYIEGCYRVKIDSNTINGHPYQFLSSGVEDFYLSGFAFDRGVYHGDNSGCTYILGGPSNTMNITMAAYKFFENDPILFSDSISLMWKTGSNGDCPNVWPPNKGSEKDINEDVKVNADQTTTVTSYAWVYTYNFS
eukprot:207301_1